MLRRNAKTIAIAAGIAYALFLGAFGAIIIFSEGLLLIGVCVVIMGALILVMAIATTFHFADRDARRRVFKEDSGAYAAISRYRRQFTNPPSTYQPAHEQHPVVVQIPSYVPPDMSDTAIIKRTQESAALLPSELPRPRTPKPTDVPPLDDPRFQMGVRYGWNQREMVGGTEDAGGDDDPPADTTREQEET